MKNKLKSLLKDVIPNIREDSYTSISDNSLGINFHDMKAIYTWSEEQGFFTFYCNIYSELIHADRSTVLNTLNELNTNGSIAYMMFPDGSISLRLCCYITKEELNLSLLNEVMYVLVHNAKSIISTLN